MASPLTSQVALLRSSDAVKFHAKSFRYKYHAPCTTLYSFDLCISGSFKILVTVFMYFFQETFVRESLGISSLSDFFEGENP